MPERIEQLNRPEVTTVKFTMGGRELHIVSTAIVDGSCLEVTLSGERAAPRGIHPEWKIDRASGKSQQQNIKDYLLAGHTITPLEALEMFGCFRLGAQIFDLKKKGMSIDMKMKKDENTGKRYAVYSIAPPGVNKE